MTDRYGTQYQKKWDANAMRRSKGWENKTNARAIALVMFSGDSWRLERVIQRKTRAALS